MDTMQPWNQMGQGYFRQRSFNRVQSPDGVQSPDRTKPDSTQPSSQVQGQKNPAKPDSNRKTEPTWKPDTSQQMEWLSGLSREEKLEAKRLALQASFSFEGYQVVRREFISHRFDPAMTIRGTSITFNNACISKLEDATYIHFLINPTEMKLLIRAVKEGTRDAVRWCIVKGDKRKSRQISCKPFTTRLYEMMGWNPLYRYKMQGIKIKYEGEDMYLFDLKAVECFVPQHRDPKTGKVPVAKAILPDEWKDSYGMSVEEHTASTQVDLEHGFTDVMMDSSDKKDMTEAPNMYVTPDARDATDAHDKQVGKEEDIVINRPQEPVISGEPVSETQPTAVKSTIVQQTAIQQTSMRRLDIQQLDAQQVDSQLFDVQQTDSQQYSEQIAQEGYTHEPAIESANEPAGAEQQSAFSDNELSRRYDDAERGDSGRAGPSGSGADSPQQGKEAASDSPL